MALLSNEQVVKHSVQIRAPYTNGTDNSNMLLLASSTAHAALTIPATWEDEAWITIQVYGTSGKSIWFLCSELSTAEVDRSIAAAADGAGDPKLGKRVQVGEIVSFQLPHKSSIGAPRYLINETDDATTTAEIWLSSYGGS